MTGEREPGPETVRAIAEEIEQVTAGRVGADAIGADTALWGAASDGTALNLTSLEYLDLLYRVEDRTGRAAPAWLEPVMTSTVGDLARVFTEDLDE